MAKVLPSKKKKINAREEKFCQLYSVLGNLQKAVVGAGFPVQGALERGACLLAQDEVQEHCRKLLADRQEEAVIGLRRLAFSPVNDVVRLLSAEKLPLGTELAEMDLFCVSKIKQNKEGGLEVELYDRFLALQALLDRRSELTKGDTIYDAIHRSAAAMRKSSDAPEIL